jgi:hypothetical protein
MNTKRLRIIFYVFLGVMIYSITQQLTIPFFLAGLCAVTCSMVLMSGLALRFYHPTDIRVIRQVVDGEPAFYIQTLHIFKWENLFHADTREKVEVEYKKVLNCCWRKSSRTTIDITADLQKGMKLDNLMSELDTHE